MGCSNVCIPAVAGRVGEMDNRRSARQVLGRSHSEPGQRHV